MKALTFPLVSEKAVALANEFAEVTVEVKPASKGSLVTITDKGTGAQASLEPAAAFAEVLGSKTPSNKAVAVRLDLDLTANGPRLKITHLQTGAAVFLDPLQLSDAALAGEWGKFPAVYEEPSADKI